MKYTRYDIKKKRSSNLVFGAVLFFTLIFALIIGTIVSNIVFKNSDIGKLQDKPKPSNAINVLNPDTSNESEKKLKFIAVQVGVYKNPQGAEIVKSELNQYGSPFTVEDEKGIRVILGVFTEEKAANIIRNLSEKNIANSKIIFDIAISNNCDSVIMAVINNELEILSKLSENGIKSYKTNDFKKWLSELEEVNKNDRNYVLLSELKTHVNNLPEELGKEKAPESYQYIYNLIKKISQQ